MGATILHKGAYVSAPIALSRIALFLFAYSIVFACIFDIIRESRSLYCVQLSDSGFKSSILP